MICCHNSQHLITPTLNHLADQIMEAEIPWEVIVVDNGSSDQTADVVRAVWPERAPARLRVVNEANLGLAFARERGFQASQFEIVSFLDDDNWVANDWVDSVYEIMSSSPDVGACGGVSQAVPESEPPAWFRQVQSKYAVGPQGDYVGDITWRRGHLWGAGLTVRKSAWEGLVARGFQHLTVGQQDRTLCTGEDTELCFALRLAGWRLRFEPRLRLSHYIPAPRLRWQYLRRRMRGLGVGSVGLDPYRHALAGDVNGFEDRPVSLWLWSTAVVIRKLARYRTKLASSRWTAHEGDMDVLAIERLTGRLLELRKRRKTYDLSIQQIRQASWRDPQLDTIEKRRNAFLEPA